MEDRFPGVLKAIGPAAGNTIGGVAPAELVDEAPPPLPLVRSSVQLMPLTVRATKPERRRETRRCATVLPRPSSIVLERETKTRLGGVMARLSALLREAAVNRKARCFFQISGSPHLIRTSHLSVNSAAPGPRWPRRSKFPVLARNILSNRDCPAPMFAFCLSIGREKSSRRHVHEEEHRFYLEGSDNHVNGRRAACNSGSGFRRRGEDP